MESSHINAVGIWLYSQSTQRYLYLLRNDPKHPGAWGLPGGKVEAGETLINAIKRECTEELGSYPSVRKILPIEHFTSADNKFIYHTFFGVLAEEFIPCLNYEHLGYAWVNSGEIPKPLHPGFWSTINVDEIQNKIKTIETSLT
jgi:8-oxo-dGTP pyrophosphatase MutT (NUDIX family)